MNKYLYEKSNRETYVWEQPSTYDIINSIIKEQEIKEELMGRKIYLYEVTFNGSCSVKKYKYWSYLKLEHNGNYEIVADKRTTYSNTVLIVSIDSTYNPIYTKGLREITAAKRVDVIKRTDGNVKNIYLNKEKGTTVVVWNDGSKTKVKCQDGEEFDAEKGIALCFMKKACDNRACFNEILKSIAINIEVREI